VVDLAEHLQLLSPYYRIVSSVYIPLFTCVIGPPHLVTSRYVRRHLIRPGERLRLPCPVRANPPALVTWYKDGGTIHLGWDRYRVRADDWTLSVRDVQLDDTGIFTCRATNGFGSIDITYLVYVSRKIDSLCHCCVVDHSIYTELPVQMTGD